MNKLRRKYSVLVLIISLYISSCITGSASSLYSMKCIRSFQEFAYSNTNVNTQIETNLPLAPWKPVTQIPFQNIEGYQVSGTQLVASRAIGGNEEIWLFQSLAPIDGLNERSRNYFLIYEAESQNWKSVSANIGDSGLYVMNIFVTHDGSIWGQTIWNIISPHRPTLEQIPVLSKFNEETQKFEFVTDIVEIPWTLETSSYFPWPEIILDNNDVFWVFIKNDGIYSYDSVTDKTEKQASLLDLDVTELALSPDGSIYFQVYTQRIYLQNSFFRVLDGMLYQFIPETKDIISLPIPDEPWPMFSGMLVNHDGNLWLGAIGYRDRESNWNLIYPDPEKYFATAGDVYAAPPTLVLASSDETLWYIKQLDDARLNGMAFYHPKTKEGCMFTNTVSNIIEDSEKRLWLVADGKLLNYQLPSN